MMNARALTDNEIRMARQVFNATIDYTRVRIVSDAWWLLAADAAMCVGNHIVFPKHRCSADFTGDSLFQQAWLIHELTHVWQYQQGFSVWWGGVCLGMRGGYVRRRAYRCPDLAGVAHWGKLNMEQQAEVMAQFFLAVYAADTRYVPLLPHYRRLLRPFFRQSHNHSLLPHY